MLKAIKDELNAARTENGAVTNRTTGKACLDLFATIGALRHADEQEICGRFLKAYAEDPDLAMKILFYARDVRGGLGERRVFRTVLTWLAANEKGSVVRNLPLIAEYGRWDDVLEEFRKVNPAVAGSLDGSFAATAGNIIFITSQNRFFITLFKTKENAVSLGETINRVLGQRFVIKARCATTAAPWTLKAAGKLPICPPNLIFSTG